jgi:hypothetical protein
VYGNRTHWELCSNPPTVLKTVASASRANTLNGFASHFIPFVEAGQRKSLAIVRNTKAGFTAGSRVDTVLV